MRSKFQHIIDQHHGILYKIGRAYSHNKTDFEDLYQEMLIQLWQSFPRFQQQSKLSTYIYRVVLNTALTHQRKQKRQLKAVPLEEQAFRIKDHSGGLPIAAYEKEKEIDLLYECINELKKEDRAIILLHLEGRSYEEMAEITGLSSSNIGVRLLRLKKKLHKLLIKKGYERV